MSFATFCPPSASTVSAHDLPEVEFAEWTGDDSPTEAVAVDPIIRAEFMAPRKQLLDRIRSASRGDAVRLSVNGSVDFSALFGSKEIPEGKAGVDSAGKPCGETVPAHWSTPEYRVELRDDWQRSGELAAVIPADRIVKILAKVKSDDTVKVTLTHDPDKKTSMVRIATGRTDFHLEADAVEFPDDLEVSGPQAIVSAAELLRGIEQTEYAADVESTRYALGGILVEFRGGILSLAATDSRRLAVVSLTAAVGPDVQGVIPAKAIADIARQLKGQSGDVTLTLADPASHSYGGAAAFSVECAEWTVKGQCVDGRFPDYRQVIPTNWNGTATLDRAEFLESLEAAMMVTSEESRGVDFTFDPDRLTLSASAAGVGSAAVGMPAKLEAIDERPDAITLDPRYVIDYVKRQDANEVQLSFLDHESAILIEAIGGARYISMPLSRDR